jgi:hypothetical protein
LVLVRARGVPTTVEEEEAARPLGSFEKEAIETAHRYEPMIVARYSLRQASGFESDVPYHLQGVLRH